MRFVDFWVVQHAKEVRVPNFSIKNLSRFIEEFFVSGLVGCTEGFLHQRPPKTLPNPMDTRTQNLQNMCSAIFVLVFTVMDNDMR